MADQNVGAGFDQLIGTRPSKANPSVTEYYNLQSGAGFSNPQDLANFVGVQTQRSDVNSGNVFDVVKTGFAPRSQALGQIKDELNSFQNSAFDQEQTADKRQSSSLQESISLEQQNLNSYLDEFNQLRKKMSGLAAPNYTEEFSRLRTEQAIPQLESDFLGVRQTRRELPYVERANTGNAAVATEAQLQAQTAQKDIPLEIREGNLIDRLKLAADFVTNALKLKELDFNTSRQGITDAINLIGQTIDLSRQQLSDYYTRQKEERDLALSAQQFAIENGIDAPLYQVGNIIYDTATRTPKYVNDNGTIKTADGKIAFPTPDQFFKHSGVSSFDQIYHINSTTLADKNAVLDLRQKYPDAGISASDSFAIASSKLQNSRIYQEQVRPPARGGSGGGLTPYQQLQYIGSITDNARQDPNVKDFAQIRAAYETARSAATSANSAGDIVLMRTLAKITDPSTGVREEEYKTFQGAVGTLPRYGVQMTSQLVGKGQLTAKGRQILFDQIQSIYNQREAAYNNSVQFYNNQAQQVGGNIAFPTYTAPVSGPVNTAGASQPQSNSGGFINKAINWLFGK